MDPKIDTLSQVDTRVLAIVGVSKLFLIFFEVIGYCFRPKGLLLCVFTALKVDKWPQNRDFRSKFCPLWPFLGVIFDHAGGQKSRFWTFSKLFKSCLESVWALFSALKDLLLRVFVKFNVSPNCSLSFGVPRKPYLTSTTLLRTLY